MSTRAGYAGDRGPPRGPATGNAQGRHLHSRIDQRGARVVRPGAATGPRGAAVPSEECPTPCRPTRSAGGRPSAAGGGGPPALARRGRAAGDPRPGPPELPARPRSVRPRADQQAAPGGRPAPSAAAARAPRRAGPHAPPHRARRGDRARGRVGRGAGGPGERRRTGLVGVPVPAVVLVGGAVPRAAGFGGGDPDTTEA